MMVPRILNSYDVREVVVRIVDGRDSASSYKYGKTLVIAFARVHGHPVGSSPTTACCSHESVLKRIFTS